MRYSKPYTKSRRNRRKIRRPIPIEDLLKQIDYPFIDPIEIVPLVPYNNSEPAYDCCKGCYNWKGANTVCNCSLPLFEMLEGTGDVHTVTVSKIQRG